MKRFLTLAVAMTMIAGCDITALIQDFLNPQDNQPDETGSAKLIPFASEDDLTNYFAQQVNAQNEQVSTFVDTDQSRGDSNGAVDLVAEDGGAGGAIPPGEPTAGFDDAANAENVSQTTLQEVGVDEADVIKTDGTYLYLIANSKLKIVRINPAEQLAMMGEMELEGYGRDIYLRDGMVVALSESGGGFFVDPIFEGDVAILEEAPPADDVVSSEPIGDGSGGSSGMSDAGEPEPDFKPDEDIDVVEPGFAPERYERPKTVVSFIDVSDPTNPAIITQYKFEGIQSSSRMVDGNLYLVLANFQHQFFDIMPRLGTPDMQVEPMPAEMFLPKFERLDEMGTVESGDVLTWTNLFRPEDPDGFGIVSVVSIDTNAPDMFESVGVMAEPGLIYSSRDSLYLTDTNYDFRGRQRETTDIYKFEYIDGIATPVATGSVPGRILNQYSMGEHDGFLRIASTVSPVFDQNFNQIEPTHNNVYVLEQIVDELTMVGSVTDIAPRETIQSARFVGDKGYVVTFEQIDPLFTLDLADPRNPQIIGELKVPGFSTFIVPMDDDHLLTVGQYIPEGDDARFRPWGVQLSIFDVSDFANPFLEHLYIIGDETGASSEALYNPKAFNFRPEEGMVALPINIFGNRPIFFEDDIIALEDEREPFDDGVDLPTDGADSGGTFDGDPADEPMPSDTPSEEPPVDVFPVEPFDEPFFVDDSFDGVMVFNLSADTGFTPMGRLSMCVEQSHYYGASFTRALFLDGKVFAVTDRAVKAATMPDIESESGRFELIIDDRDSFNEFPDGPIPTEPGIGDGADPLPIR